MKVEIGAVDPYKFTYPLLINGDLWHQVHASIFGKFPKFPETYSQEELDELFSLLERKGAKNFLLRRLAMKNYHSTELLAALAKRGVDEAVSLPLLAEFSQQGYLNDEAWLNSSIRALRQQRFGFKAIEMKMRMKGIREEEVLIAIKAIKESEGEEDGERHSIVRLLETRYRSRDLSDRKEKQKVIAGLMRKGFSLDDIFGVLKTYSSQQDP